MRQRLRFENGVNEDEIKEAVSEERVSGSTDQLAITTEDKAAQTYYRKRVVPIVGHVPTARVSGMWRWACGNVNGLATNKTANFKADQLTALRQKYDINGYSFCEIGVDSRAFKPSQSVATFLQIPEPFKTSTATNKYQPRLTGTKALQGGCSVIVAGEVSQYGKLTKGGNDHRGLGRWSSLLLQSHPMHRTRIVSAYNVGRPKTQLVGSVYQQHLRYIQNNNLDVSPRRLMREDFLEQLKQWLQQGDRILLYMDANENVLDGPLCQNLSSLGFAAMAHRLIGSVPNTHVEGSECIDEVWASHGLEVTAIQLMSFHQSVGDHRTFLVDFTTRSAVGLFHHLIVQPQCRRLVTSNRQATTKYLELVEAQWEIHRIEERLNSLASMQVSFPVDDQLTLRLERLDRQIGEIMLHAENNCRKITKIDGEYSLPTKYWHERVLALKSLLRRLDGRTRNNGNICRAARRHGIANPRRLDRKQIDEQLKVAVARKETNKPQAKFHRKQHLKACLARAVYAKNKEKANDIRAKMANESSRSMWRRIKRVVNPPHPGALLRVEREIDGETHEFTEEHDVVHNILDVIQDRYSGADDACISNCSLTPQLGLFCETSTGLDLAKGNLVLPDDVDDATRRVLSTIGEVGAIHADNAVDLDLSGTDYTNMWNKARERTSSSMSGRHFGHYRACSQSTTLAYSLALKLSLHAKWGAPPERWKNVLMVMLEKKLGVVLVQKLRAILLKEADNNQHDGYVFGHRMMTRAREIGFIPQEQIAEKESTAEDGVFAKVLKADYARLRRQAIAVIAADAANCYDLVNHLILSLLLRALGVPIGPIVSMLSTIMLMRCYLRTGFGESSAYMGGDLSTRRVHGLNQGGRAAPPCWSVVSSILVAIQRARGHLAIVTTAISQLVTAIVGFLYVDDTDLYVLNCMIRTNEELVSASQASLTDWGSHLMATGGQCKPEKCFGYLVNYSWDEQGNWRCDSLVEGYELCVPTVAGTKEPITLHDASEGTKSLGVYTALDGNSQAHLSFLRDKVDTWTARISNGHLPVSFNWTSYIFQLWTSIRYGIGALPADEEEIDGFLSDSNRAMLPFLGVNRNIRTGWRTLHRSFLGIGLFDFSTELLVQRINMFLQHYDSPYDIGITLRATMELVQLEAGLADCPLNHPFYPFGLHVTHCWFRSFWQALSLVGMKMKVDYPEIALPRERDRLLIQLYADSGYDPQFRYFHSWQKCRIKCHAIFLSDLTSPDGRVLDSKYVTNPADMSPPLSKYDFSNENPCEEDWLVWLEFWDFYTLPGLELPISLGPWVHSTHRINEWYYHQESDVMFRRSSGGGQYYGRTEKGGTSRRSQQRFHALGPSPTIPDLTSFSPCLATCTTDGAVILGPCGPPQYDPPPVQHDLFSLLKSWGGDWMWEDIKVVGSFDDILAAYRNGSALWCTDGSHDRVMMPDISASGWVVFDPLTKSHLRGSFHEVSLDSAGSYRGELLGLTALHLVGLALAELFGKPEKQNPIYCDNERALHKAKLHCRRISPTTKHGDCLRLLRNIKPALKDMFRYIHIYGHADDKRGWSELSLVEKLNVYCDTIAKQARLRSAGHQRILSQQSLPRERAALFLNSVKQVGDISEATRWAISLAKARKFYVEDLGWTPSQFDAVDWRSLDRTIMSKRNGYTLWLAKQASTFCGTRLQVSRMTPGADDRCPNCLCSEERSTHLNVCPNINRTRQFKESVEELSLWLSKEHTHPDIAFWIPRYLLARNRVLFQALPSYIPAHHSVGLSSQMRAIAIGQDNIGWLHFLEGKITGHFRSLQHIHLRSSHCRLNADDWCKQFITRLLKISHTQWVFRNLTLHDAQFGHLALLRREELARELEGLQALDPRDVPPDSAFLLDFDPADLTESDISKQEQWIMAMQAARKAGMRIRGRRRRWQHSRRRLRRRHDPPLRPFRSASLRATIQHDVFEEFLDAASTKRPSEASLSLSEGSNKRRKRRKLSFE